MSDFLSCFQKFDFEALHNFLKDFNPGKKGLKTNEMKEIIEICFHFDHYEVKRMVKLLIEFGIIKPNKKIKGVNYRWMDVCMKNNFKDSADLLVCLGEKKGNYKKEERKRLKKMAPEDLFTFKGKEKQDCSSKTCKWNNLFATKFKQAREKFGIEAEIALALKDGVPSCVLYQRSSFFTPYSATEFCENIPADEDFCELGAIYRGISFTVLKDFYLEGTIQSNFIVLVEREESLSEKDSYPIYFRPKEEPKKKKKGFGSILKVADVFSSRQLFDVPENVLGNQSKIKEIERKFQKIEIQNPQTFKKNGVVDVSLHKKDGGESIICFKTQNIIYLLLVSGVNPYETRSLCNFVDQILITIGDSL